MNALASTICSCSRCKHEAIVAERDQLLVVRAQQQFAALESGKWLATSGPIALKDMTDTHLSNAIAYQKSRPALDEERPIQDGILQLLTTELSRRETMHTQLEPILTNVYTLCESLEDQRASEVVLGWLEENLRNGQFALVDMFLVEADASKLRATALLTILAITIHGRDHLPARASFRERAQVVMTKEIGKARTLKLLATR